MLRPFVIAALLAPAFLPIAVGAQTAVVKEAPPQRIRSVTLTPGQKCPPNSSEEIVVCSTLDQPYRIPKGLRDTGPVPAKNQSWVNRAANVDQVSRVAGGLPDTCSPVGTGGQTGCALQSNRQWVAEERARRAEADAATTTTTTTTP